MSESRAKKERKTQVQEKVVVKKKDPSSIIINIIIVLVVIAVAGCGVWAAYDKISANIAAKLKNSKEIPPRKDGLTHARWRSWCLKKFDSSLSCLVSVFF